jgi:glycosyltransferase involved in cell wall biosynthesis
MADVSVIIPAFNAERFLAEAIRTALGQTLRPAEVIVVDDGSTDSTAAIAGQFSGVRLCRHEHSGVSVARNTGAKASTGAYLAFLDADDLWHAEKLELQSAVLDEDAQTDIAACRHTYVIEEPVPTWFRGPRDGSVAPGYLLIPSLIRRTAWDLVGEFDSTLSHGEDGDWLFRALDLGIKVRVVDQPLMMYRIHGANASSAGAAVREGILRTLRASVQRKREGARDG